MSICMVYESYFGRRHFCNSATLSGFSWRLLARHNKVLIDQVLFRIESILTAKDSQNTAQMFCMGEVGDGDEVLRYYKNYHKALFM